jgi:hypothetical protein
MGAARGPGLFADDWRVISGSTKVLIVMAMILKNIALDTRPPIALLLVSTSFYQIMILMSPW